MTTYREQDDDDFDPPRRSFFTHLLTAAIGAVVSLIPLVPGGLFFLHPILSRKKEEQGEGELIPLGIRLDSLADDGTPLFVKVVADKSDAWNLHRNVPIGKVWLRKNAAGELIAFNATCPHLGCIVGYRAAEKDFFCPCHTSSFDIQGERTNEIPPRNMDSLTTKIAADGQIAVRYIDFRTGTSEQVRV